MSAALKQQHTAITTWTADDDSNAPMNVSASGATAHNIFLPARKAPKQLPSLTKIRGAIPLATVLQQPPVLVMPMRLVLHHRNTCFYSYLTYQLDSLVFLHSTSQKKGGCWN